MRALVLAVAVAIAGAAVTGTVAGTDAAFDARTASGEVVSLLSVEPPSALAVEPSGNDVALSWSAGTHATGYQVRAGATCGYMVTVGEPAATSHTDTPAVAAGTPRCYGVVTTAGPWTSMAGNPALVVQVGFVATAISMADGGCGLVGVLDCGDTFVVTFNQPATPVSLTSACTDAATGAIALGCGSDRGTLHGGTVDADARYEATSAWSNGNRTVTVTIGDRTEGTVAPAVSGTWTFTPAGLASATGSVAVCATAGDCRPTTSTTP